MLTRKQKRIIEKTVDRLSSETKQEYQNNLAEAKALEKALQEKALEEIYDMIDGYLTQFNSDHQGEMIVNIKTEVNLDVTHSINQNLTNFIAETERVRKGIVEFLDSPLALQELTACLYSGDTFPKDCSDLMIENGE